MEGGFFLAVFLVVSGLFSVVRLSPDVVVSVIPSHSRRHPNIAITKIATRVLVDTDVMVTWVLGFRVVTGGGRSHYFLQTSKGSKKTRYLDDVMMIGIYHV
jgi:hypothetical protein